MENVSDVYSQLYHYTDFNGVHGILKTQKIWSTHFKFLNDKKEILLAMENLLPEIFYPHIKNKYNVLLEENPDIKQNIDNQGYSLEQIVQHDLHEAILKSLYTPLEDQIYITSFCGESSEFINQNGLLSQWRGYGGDGGFCIVFDTKELETQINNEYKNYSYGYAALCDVIYEHDKEKFEEDLEESYTSMVDFFIHMIEKMFAQEEPDDDVKAPYAEFLNCITRIKHQGFKEENEVRLVTHIPHDLHLMDDERRPQKPILFRENIPYIEMLSTKDQKLPIKKIIVGPNSEQNQRVAYLKTLLINDNIEITASEIPYVG